MSSKNEGKAEIVAWVKENIKQGSKCLDVGACDGLWFNLLGDYLKMDACEAYEPNAEKYQLEKKYNRVMCVPIARWLYWHYKLVIFGDVIEHMEVPEAQSVLQYAQDGHADNIIVAVPYLYPQGAIYGNPYEVHKQPDLTHEIFMSRYPGFEPLFIYPNYGYYLWRAKNE